MDLCIHILYISVSSGVYTSRKVTTFSGSAQGPSMRLNLGEGEREKSSSQVKVIFWCFAFF